MDMIQTPPENKFNFQTSGILTRPWWKLSMRVWDYIVREAVTPFVMALTVIMFVFLLQFLMRFIDRIVGKGLDIWTILQLIAFNLAWMVVLAVPMAVLVACVMAFGALASSNELTALKAAGVSLGRMLFPVMLLSVLIGVLDLQFNNIILPDANHRAKDLMTDIQRKKPSLVVEPGTFTTDDEIPGYSILARQASKSGDLQDVTIYDHGQPSEARVITAKFAHLAFTRDFRNIILTLKDGEIHQQVAQQPTEYRRGHFGTYVVQVPTTGYDFMHEGESQRSDRELSAKALLQFVKSRSTTLDKQTASLRDHFVQFAKALNSPHPDPVPQEQSAMVKMRAFFSPQFLAFQNEISTLTDTEEDIDSYMVEVHKKYAIPASCIIFALIGVPLGALAKRSGVGAGTGLSIGFFVLYWIFLIGGEKLADRDVITPFWGMWGGNVILLVVGIFLTWRVTAERQLQITGKIKELWTSKIRRKPEVIAT
jgi:lipopolysaccharide export system permease protein